MSVSFPRQDSPIAEFGRMGRDWYKFLRELWQHTGAGEANHPRYNDLVVTAPQMSAEAIGNDATFAAVTAGGTKEVFAYSFAAAADKYKAFGLQLPHGWVPGTAIKPHLQWMPATAAAGNVRWRLEYAWWSIDGSAVTATTTVAATAAAPAVAKKLQKVEFDDIAGTSMGVSSVLLCTVSRFGTSPLDTYGAAAYLLSAGIHALIGGIATVQPFP